MHESVLNPYASCSVHEMYHDLSMLVSCFRGHTFVDNFIYELQKSTTIAFSRNSLYTVYPRNPTCGIQQCLRIFNRKYPPMPSEFHNREPPLPFGNPKSRPWYGMDIFWNRPFHISSLQRRLTNSITTPKQQTFHPSPPRQKRENYINVYIC